MRYRWFVLALVILIPVGVVLIGPYGGYSWPPPTVPHGNPSETGEEALGVIQAVSDLSNQDYVVVRNAIRQLRRSIYAPNIYVAIYPLMDVLGNVGRFHDSHTRGMAANALVRIGVAIKGQRGNQAIEYVINELEEGPTDTVRASCAYALGLSGREIALDSLISANEDDPSPVVRETACEALMMLTNGRYYSEDCHYGDEEEAGGIVTTFSSGGDVRTMESGKVDELRWLKTHLLVPLDILLSEDETGSGDAE